MSSSPAWTYNGSLLSALPANFSIGAEGREEDFWEDGGSAEEAVEDGNVMNRPLVKAFFLVAYILVFLTSVFGSPQFKFITFPQFPFPRQFPRAHLHHL